MKFGVKRTGYRKVLHFFGVCGIIKNLKIVLKL